MPKLNKLYREHLLEELDKACKNEDFDDFDFYLKELKTELGLIKDNKGDKDVTE
jgi:hypothetical protein